MSNVPPLIKATERLMLEVERAVSAFPRKHRYALGSDLRKQAMDIALLTQRAFRAARDRDAQATIINQLADKLDQLKLSLQIAQRLQAFSSFGCFEELARLAALTGRQVGGWRKQVSRHLNGQNPASHRLPERPATLSSHAASQGVRT